MPANACSLAVPVAMLRIKPCLMSTLRLSLSPKRLLPCFLVCLASRFFHLRLAALQSGALPWARRSLSSSPICWHRVASMACPTPGNGAIALLLGIHALEQGRCALHTDALGKRQMVLRSEMVMASSSRQKRW